MNFMSKFFLNRVYLTQLKELELLLNNIWKDIMKVLKKIETLGIATKIAWIFTKI